MKVRIEKGVARGEIAAPPSKSMAHRLLIAAALSQGESVVRGLSRCEDVQATLDCLRAFSVDCELRGEDAFVSGRDFKTARATAPLFCRESGSTLRFLVPLAMLSGHPALFCGAPGLMRRPMSVYEALFSQKGLSYAQDARGIAICGPLPGGEYALPGNVSSQFITGLLFALPLADADSILRLTPPVESRSYIQLTLAALEAFGVSATWRDENTLTVRGGQAYRPADVTVEGDASGAAFPDALNLFGGDVCVRGIRRDSMQGDAIYPKLFAALESGAPTLSLADCPDLAPVLFAVAAAKHGGTFVDTQRLKIKESDRAEVMATELRKFGARVTVQENAVIIEPAAFHAPDGVLQGHGDHRIVMALSVLLTLTGGEIDGAQAVAKSYPEFFDHLKQLGIEVHTL